MEQYVKGFKGFTPVGMAACHLLQVFTKTQTLTLKMRTRGALQ